MLKNENAAQPAISSDGYAAFVFYVVGELKSEKTKKYQIKETPMDPSIPNEDERKKLQKMAMTFKFTIINIIILSGIYWIVRYLLDQYPVIQINHEGS